MRSLWIGWVAAVLVMAGWNDVAGQPNRAVDSIVAHQMREQHIPGAAVAVVQNGRVVLSKGYGIANLEWQTPVTDRTVFKIASVSKQLIASGVMLLAQEGKLKTSDPVSRYYPDAPASWAPLTLAHFMNHTGGVVREGAFDPYRQQPDSVVVKGAFGRDLLFPVGSKWSYCNTCYFALADIISRLSGQPWEEYFQARIFRPLGMTATGVTTATGLIPHRADGYVWRNNVWSRAEDIPAVRPSGAFVSTVADLAKWELALEGNGVLTAASKREMWAPTVLTDGTRHGYGYGWSLDSLAGRPRISHGGALTGFRTTYMRFPEQRLAVIVLTNVASANPDRIAEGIAGAFGIR
ncbi:MAG: beta-lactamase family protein [Gemmatimonadales bacterium]|nr:beta-lactamase family protein [Gemmatimonadales bacterium]